MIGKVLRGHRVAGLLYYLYGPGKHEEHTDPHIVAGWRTPGEVEPPLRPGGRRDFRELNGLLQQPLAALGERAPARPVWHCVARAAPGDRLLSDQDWARVASEIMHRTGLAPGGQEDDAVRWVAVRHGADHIHIVAVLARQDGCRASVSNDYYKVRDACLAMEQHFGLRLTAPADRTAAARPTRAETEKAQRHGRRQAPRVVLHREVSTAAAAAGSEAGFFARLEQAGIQVRFRYSVREPGQVTGYAVALPGDTTQAGVSVFYSGGKLAADLTLPKLRHRWTSAATGGTTSQTAPGAEERSAIWEHAGRACTDASTQIHACLAAGDHASAADAAWAAADTLRSAAAALRHPAIRRAATAFDRASRMPYGRLPRATRSGCELRRAARMLSAAAFTTHDRQLAHLALILRLAALTDAVAQLRRAQGHVAQAAAARAAAEHLRSAAYGTTTGTGPDRSQVTAAALGQAAFPGQQPPRRPAGAVPRRLGTPPPRRRRTGQPPRPSR